MISFGNLRKVEREAWKTRTPWESEWQDIYRWAFPDRAGFYEDTPSTNKSRQVFDETAQDSVTEFASTFAENFHDFRLVPGPELTEGRAEAQAVLDEITAIIHRGLTASAIEDFLYECWLNIGVGWCAGSMFEPRVAGTDFELTAFPQPQISLSVGPGGRVDGFFRRWKMTLDQFKTWFPKATGFGWIKDEDAEEQFLWCDACVRDWSEAGSESWLRYVWGQAQPEDRPALWGTNYRGFGSNPFVEGYWTRETSTIYGKGPLWHMLGAIRRLNFINELGLENLDLSVAGLWLADDDGTVAVDSITLDPGTIIGREPGTAGLESVAPAGNFDHSMWSVEQLQQAIRHALFNRPKRDQQRTPRSATEIVDNNLELAQRGGQPYMRVFNSLGKQIIIRAAFMQQRRGRFQLPRVNGRQIAIQAASPIAEAIEMEEVNRLGQADAAFKQLVGEQIATTYYNPENMLNFVREKMRLPSELYVSRQQAQQRQQSIVQAMQAQEAPPGGQVPGA